MSDAAVRVAAAVAVTLAALGVALAARAGERRRAAAAPVNLAGIPGRVVLFTDTACRRCGAARERLRRAGVEFTEVAYERAPERFAAAGVRAVPLLVGRGSRGEEVARVAGRVTPRALARLLARVAAE